MSDTHRVEVLYNGVTDRFEYWQNLTARVRLFRRRGADHWVAMVDGKLVTDQERGDRHIVSTAAMRALRAPSVEQLIPLLAMEVHVHCVLDHAEAWGRGDDALWLEPRGDDEALAA